MSTSSTRVEASLSLGTIGLITWIVFMIMDYGCQMDWIVNANNAVRVGSHFWTWFPLWAPAALGGIGLLFLLVFVVIAALDGNHI